MEQYWICGPLRKAEQNNSGPRGSLCRTRHLEEISLLPYSEKEKVP